MADEIRFTDEEHAFLRYARFGELPGRVPPEERVELTESAERRQSPTRVGEIEHPLRWVD
jgi:hypothetical protein